MTSAAPAAPPTPNKKPREWAPHIWEGCDWFAWLRLLARNRFAVGPRQWYVAAIVNVVSFCHTLLRWSQEARYGAAIARTPVRPPLFILGHWRSGTTLLHELLILDDRHAFPTTLQCFDPNHFLLTEEFMKRYLWFLAPERRPMDKMAAGWDRPQEDEFALCMLGLPSPYLTIAFPNRPPQDQEYLDFAGVPPKARSAWQRRFRRYLQTLSFKYPGKRLVLKSPPHTARIPVLLEMFPDARFVHIVRDPYVLFPSTVNLWKALYRAHGLQTPTHAGLEDHVFATFVRMYEAFEKGRSMIPPGRFHEVRYEVLVRDPIGEMATVYDRLELGGFAAARPRLEAYWSANAGYETNKYQLAPAVRDEITRRWGDWIRKWGYGA